MGTWVCLCKQLLCIALRMVPDKTNANCNIRALGHATGYHIIRSHGTRLALNISLHLR